MKNKISLYSKILSVDQTSESFNVRMAVPSVFSNFYQLFKFQLTKSLGMKIVYEPD